MRGIGRRLFACFVALGLVASALVACGNAKVAPTVTSVPPPPPTAAIAPSPTQAPVPTPRYSEPDLIPASWVAYSPETRIRFFAPPSLIDVPDRSHSDSSLILYSASESADAESVAIVRLRGRSGGDSDATWKSELDSQLRLADATDYSVTFGPSPQLVSSFLGERGQFNYAQHSNGQRFSGTIWVGQVGTDILEIIYRAIPAREAAIDRAMAQVMSTIDFDAGPSPVRAPIISVPPTVAPPISIPPTSAPPLTATPIPRPTSTPVPPPTATTVPRAPTNPGPVSGSGNVCPAGYPVKANDNSGIYHVPGQRFYVETNARNCFTTPAAAQAAGYRASKV